MAKMILETKTGIPDNFSQQISDLEEQRAGPAFCIALRKSAKETRECSIVAKVIFFFESRTERSAHPLQRKKLHAEALSIDTASKGLKGFILKTNSKHSRSVVESNYQFGAANCGWQKRMSFSALFAL
jgi:hypothetical protein